MKNYFTDRYKLASILKSTLLLLTLLCVCTQTFAVTKTWVGTTNAYSVTTKWSESEVPGSTDIAFFNNSANCKIDGATFSVATFSVGPSYSSTITQTSAAQYSVTTFINVAGTTSTFSQSGTFNVGAYTLAAATYQLRLMNLLGQTMYKNTIDHTGGSNNYPVEFSATLPNGMYNMEVVKPDQSVTMIKTLINR